MKRPRRTGKQTTPDQDAPSGSAGAGRPTRVRNRLVIAVAVVAAAIAAAGAPSILAASGQVSDSQDLVTFAGQTGDALSLAHALADERDGVTAWVAAGRTKSKAPAEQQSARVDREVEDLRADPDIPAALRKDLDDVSVLRRAALVGKSTALETHRAYSAAITELHALADQLAERIPSRAGSGGYPLADLDSAVQQSAAARGLLLAALNVPRTAQSAVDPVTGRQTTTWSSSDADAKQRDELTAAAQQAAVRSAAALADFRDNAPAAARNSYDSTVTGSDATAAEKYLAQLTDQPTLSDDDLGVNTRKVDDALSARIEMMRGVESSLYESRGRDLAHTRDDDVTALEIRITVLGVLMLVAVGVAMGMARSLTRPLAVLRLGSARLAADPATGEPVRFTGRNDEFAQVVRSVNALHEHAVGLQERLSTLEVDRKHLIGQRQAMADERATLRTELAEARGHLEQVRHSVHSTFVNLALRTLGLVERQLSVIEGLEDREQDPERLATLFKLDHFATVMRRHSENLLVLAGTEHVQQHAGPVPLVDVVRAAVSEIERYERVRIAALPPHAHIAGFAADDLSHLLAELLENATSFSPPDIEVEISGWLLESGEVMLSVQDEGIGMTTERMRTLNGRLAEFEPEEPYDHEGGEGLGLGLYVVARLAHRHQVRVRLREQKQGGVAAVVVLPKPLLSAAPAAAVPVTGPASSGAHGPSLPGADAEANSNVLAGRARTAIGRQPEGDPLIAAAEAAVREQDEEETREPAERVAAEESVAAPAGADEAPARDAADVRPAVAAGPGRDADVEFGPETTMELLLPSPRTDEPAATPGIPAQTSADPYATGPDAPSPYGTGPHPTGPRPTGPHSADPYAIGPDAHERIADGGGQRSAPAPFPQEEPGTEARTQRHTEQPRVQPRPEPRTDPRPEPRTDPRPEPRTEPRPEPRAEPEPRTEPREAPGALPPETPAPRVTAKGLPKRTPKVSAPAPAAKPRSGGVDADALRRRLGGFHRGAQEGYRHAEAETAERTGQMPAPAPGRGPHRSAEPPAPSGSPDPSSTTAPPHHATPGTAQDVEATGGTVEEATS
ncbi:nitrate- and nitrite sensing domain-containing protein [Streptomyces sp. NPDC048664]|uniref:sensor histidine kinase n=1 Tax=Streptomyces sp. NPDC048664 TaxID=3154505 RepID=UPI0034424BE5